MLSQEARDSQGELEVHKDEVQVPKKAASAKETKKPKKPKKKLSKDKAKKTKGSGEHENNSDAVLEKTAEETLQSGSVTGEAYDDEDWEKESVVLSPRLGLLEGKSPTERQEILSRLDEENGNMALETEVTDEPGAAPVNDDIKDSRTSSPSVIGAPDVFNSEKGSQSSMKSRPHSGESVKRAASATAKDALSQGSKTSLNQQLNKEESGSVKSVKIIKDRDNKLTGSKTSIKSITEPTMMSRSARNLASESKVSVSKSLPGSQSSLRVGKSPTGSKTSLKHSARRTSGSKSSMKSASKEGSQASIRSGDAKSFNQKDGKGSSTSMRREPSPSQMPKSAHDSKGIETRINKNSQGSFGQIGKTGNQSSIKGKTKGKNKSANKDDPKLAPRPPLGPKPLRTRTSRSSLRSTGPRMSKTSLLSREGCLTDADGAGKHEAEIQEAIHSFVSGNGSTTKTSQSVDETLPRDSTQDDGELARQHPYPWNVADPTRPSSSVHKIGLGLANVSGAVYVLRMYHT